LSITSPAEHDNIANVIDTKRIGSLMWLGMSDRNQELSWEWSDKSPVSFVYWKDGQPNNFGDQDEAQS